MQLAFERTTFILKHELNITFFKCHVLLSTSNENLFKFYKEFHNGIFALFYALIDGSQF